MNEQFNRQISFILEKYCKDPPTLIQELFNLLPFQRPEEKKITQTAILYSMETIHEWENIYHYLQKWELDNFRATLIERMGRRLDEDVGSIANSNEELLRLIEKYWLTRSPKKEQNRYKEPIDIKLKTKKMQASTAKSLAQQQPKAENALAGDSSKESVNLESNSVKNSRSTVNQVEAFNSLTGRPAILKKGSMFDLSKKNKKQEPITKETKQLEIQVKTQKVSSGEVLNKKMEIEKPKTHQQRDGGPIEEKPKNVLKQLADFCGKTSKEQRLSHIEPSRPETIEEVEKKQSQTSSNAGSNSQPNQPYPSVDQFCFGSMKKTKDGDLKRLTISPNKRHTVSNKIVKIRRTEVGEPQPEDHKQEGFHNDFSFMNDNFEVLKPMSLPSSDPFAYPHTSSSETLPEFVQKIESGEMEKMKHFGSVDPYVSEEITPIFIDNKSDQKIQFLSPQELKMVEEVEPQHYMRTFMKKKGITMLNIFHEEMRKLGLR